MATKEELFAAVRLIHKHCISLKFGCRGCPLNDWCDEEYDNRDGASPDQWPDPDGFCEKGERREPNLDTTKGENHD